MVMSQIQMNVAQYPREAFQDLQDVLKEVLLEQIPTSSPIYLVQNQACPASAEGLVLNNSMRPVTILLVIVIHSAKSYEIAVMIMPVLATALLEPKKIQPKSKMILIWHALIWAGSPIG
jgi:hypothetical protein